MRTNISERTPGFVTDLRVWNRFKPKHFGLMRKFYSPASAPSSLIHIYSGVQNGSFSVLSK